MAQTRTTCHDISPSLHLFQGEPVPFTRNGIRTIVLVRTCHGRTLEPTSLRHSDVFPLSPFHVPILVSSFCALENQFPLALPRAHV